MMELEPLLEADENTEDMADTQDCYKLISTFTGSNMTSTELLGRINRQETRKSDTVIDLSVGANTGQQTQSDLLTLKEDVGPEPVVVEMTIRNTSGNRWLKVTVSDTVDNAECICSAVLDIVVSEIRY